MATLTKTKVSKRAYGGVTYVLRCDQCGTIETGWAGGISADERRMMLAKHVDCRMRRVCMSCKCVLSEGTPGAATSHGVCAKCEAAMLAESEAHDAK